MRAGEPIADFVFGIKPWKENDPVDVLPSVTQLGLQQKFLTHWNKAHDLVRSRLLDKG